MKKKFIAFIASLLLFPVLGSADETGNVISATDPAQSSQQAQDNTSVKEPVKQDESVVDKKPTPPPPIPPATSLSPEQIKTFFPKPKEENYIILNFDNADLRDVINTISSITGENFILSPGVDARITIHSAGKIPASEALSVFESILEVNNMTLVKSGRFYKIFLGATAKQKAIEVQKGKEAEALPSEDKPITQIIPVEYVPVGELSPILQPMLSQFGSIVPNPRNNLLIINDIASNIKRLLNVLKEIDVDAFQNTRMGFFQPKYSDVKILSDELREILNALNLGREGTVAIVPIERINSLVVFASSSSLLKSVEGWVKKLDEEVAVGQNIFVYPIKHVTAGDIADILKELYGIKEGAKPKPKAPVTKLIQAGQSPAPLKSEEPTGYSKVEIITFEPTNSLVILASPSIYNEIKETIKKLDVYPREVLIEVLIAEVTLEDSDQFGIQWSVLHNVSIEGDNFTGLVESRSGSPNAPSFPPATPLTLGDAGTAGLSYTLYKPDRLLAMLHALASRGKVNILSSPRLLVRDQKEATLEVGSDIPTATSTTAAAAATTTTTSTLTQNIEYKTIGIKLKIKPSINDERTVVLDIEQEVSDQLPNVTVGQEGYSYPAFSTRKTQTSIIVPDKQGIVIGGIIKERKEKNYQGIPILSSIPILGHLFRYTIDTRSKTELIVLLTPHVVTNRTEAEILTTNFMEKLKLVKDYLKQNEDINKPAPEEIKPNEQ